RNAPIFRQQISGHELHSGPFSQVESVSGDPGLSYDRGSLLLFIRAPENLSFTKGAPETQPSNVYSVLFKINNHASHHQHDDQNKNQEIDSLITLGFCLLILTIALMRELINHRAIDIGRTLRALRLAGACVLRHILTLLLGLRPVSGKGFVFRGGGLPLGGDNTITVSGHFSDRSTNAVKKCVRAKFEKRSTRVLDCRSLLCRLNCLRLTLTERCSHQPAKSRPETQRRSAARANSASRLFSSPGVVLIPPGNWRSDSTWGRR